MSDRTASQIGKSNVSTAKCHERRVAKLLTDWSGRAFRRRRVEGRESDTVLRDLTGDVVPADANNKCRFNIEAKKGKGFSFNSILENFSTCKFTSWLHQTVYDADLSSKASGLLIQPLLFFKPHPNYDWVAFDINALNFLKFAATPAIAALPFPHLLFDHYRHCGSLTFNISHTKNKDNRVMVPLQLPACFICNWTDFAKNVIPDSFFFGG